jgi:DinB family protein
MTLIEARHNIDKLAQGPDAVAAAVKGLDAKALRYKPAANKWSVVEILAHLADVEIVQGHRIRQALAEQEPTFAPMDQDAWANNLGYLECKPEELLEQFRVARRANVRLLRRVKEADLARGGYHPELKRVLTVGEIIERVSKHDPNHLGQIEKLKGQAHSA